MLDAPAPVSAAAKEAALEVLKSKPPFADQEPAADVEEAAAASGDAPAPTPASATPSSYTPPPRKAVNALTNLQEGVSLECDLETGVGCTVSEIRAAKASPAADKANKQPAVGSSCNLETGKGCSVTDMRNARAAGLYKKSKAEVDAYVAAVKAEVDAIAAARVESKE